MTLRAHVRNGRLELSEPTELPEGSVVELEPVPEVMMDDSDDFFEGMDAREAAALRSALDEGMADIRAGRTVPAEAVLATLRARAH